MGLAQIHTRVGGIRVPACHTPERILDDDGRITPDAQLEEKRLLVVTRPGAQKLAVSLGRLMPAGVFHERRVGAQVRGGGTSAVGAH